MKSKKSVRIVIAVLVAAMAAFAVVACVNKRTTPAHEHVWGAWTLSQPATTDEAVTATRRCTANDDGVDTKQLPALSDDTFWTKSTVTPAGHATEGTDTYTNAEYGTVTMTTPQTGHTWGEWTLSQPATTDEAVIATRECTASDGGVDTDELPALSDDTFWTKTNTTPATHDDDGLDTYTNADYGSVEMTVPKGHTWGDWTVENVPTNTTDKVNAKRTCTQQDCEGEETKELPAFGDSTFWTKGEEVTTANYNTAAYTEYSNAEYGLTLRMITQAKLVTAYDNQTYHSVTIEAPDDPAGAYNGKGSASKFTVVANWNTAQLTLDANGEGKGDAAPFTRGNDITFRMANPDSNNGKMTITYAEGGAERHEYTAYLDKDSKYIVMFEDDGDIVILLPDSTCDRSDPVSFSVWGEANEYRMVISYTPEAGGTPQTFFIVHESVSDVAYFGVTFTGLTGGDIAAGEAYGAACVYVKQGDKKLAAYGFDEDESKMKELDGFEGTYTAAGGNDLTENLTLNGLGKFEVGDLSGKYTISDSAAKKLLCLVTTEGASKNKTYEVTLSERTYTAKEKPVTLHFDMNGNGAATAIGDLSVPYGFEYNDLPAPEATADKVFCGWTYDADGEQEIESPFVPNKDVTLYAQWANRVDVNVHLHKQGEDDTVTKLVLAEGVSDIYAELKKLERDLNLVDTVNLVYFIGWSFTENDSENLLDTSDPLLVTSTWNGRDVHAVWKDFPVYYGNYYGFDLDNKGYEANSVGSYYHINISYDGKITGKYTAEVTGYDAATGIITAKSGSRTYYLFFDAESHTLAVQYSGITSNELDDDTEVYNVKAEINDKVPTFGIQCVRGSGSGSQSTYATLSDFKLGDNKFVFTYYKSVYTVTVTDGFGTVITDLSTLDNCTSIIIKKGDDIIYAWGVTDPSKTLKTTTETKTLDENRGAYTYGSGENLGTIALDGAVGIKIHTEGAAVSGTYTIEGSKASAFVDGAYYEITLTVGGATYAADKPMVSVTLTTSAADSGYSGETLSKNKNVQFELDAPVVEGYIFRGWFSDPDYQYELGKTEGDNVKYVFTPTDECSLYAKFVKKVTITVHFDDATLPEGALGENGTIDTFGQGEEVTIVRPSKDGKKFGGWYLDGEFGTPWGVMAADGSTTATLGNDKTAFDLYPKWDEPPVYSGEYALYKYDNDKANGGTDDGDTATSTITIDSEGESKKTSGALYPFDGNDLKVTAFEGSHMTFDRVGSSSTFTAYFDSTNKIIVFIARGTNPTGYDDILLLVPSSLTEGATVTGAQWNDGKTRVIDIKKSDGTHIGIYLTADEEPHFNVSFTDCNSSPIDDLSGAYQAESLWVMQGVEKIASFGFNGTTMVATDGFEGTYTLSSNDEYGLGDTLELNGINTAKFGAKQGVYSILEKDSKKLSVTVENVYYEVTLDGANYTIEKPMVSITFTSDQGYEYDGGTWDETQSLNTTIEIKIPALKNTATHVFRGWYRDEEFGTPLNTDDEGNYLFTPTEATTLYAKWLEKVTITVHYENGLGQKTFEYGKGEEGHPEKPAYTNGKVWNGWYKDPSCSEGQEWTDGTQVDENIELYVKWIEAVPMYGDDWVGKNVFGASGNGNGSKKLKVSADGKFSGDKDATLESYDPVTGKVVAKRNTYSGWYYGSYDIVNQILILNDGPETNPFFIGNDIDVFVKGTTMTVSNGLGVGNSNKDRIFTVSSDKISATDVLVFNGRVYGKVVFKTPEGATITITQVLDSNTTAFSAYSSAGVRIANFKKEKGEWTGTDGYEGEYTVDGGTITLNGKGGITATLGGSEKSGTYTAAADGEYTFDVYLENGGEYYELTIEAAGSGTATLTKAMVTVQFSISGSTSGLTQENKSYNKNVPVLLPVPANDTETITGWFTDDACEHPVELVDGKYTPTADVTLYAKAATKVTVTIDYGEYNESGAVPNVTLSIPSGTVLDLTPYIPPAQGGYVFEGWYANSERTEKYDNKPITDNKTIYCKWILQEFKVEIMAPSSGVQWVETEGVYRADIRANDRVEAIIKITFNVSGTFSFDWAADFDDNMADSLYVALNHNPPHQASNKVLSKTSGSGTQTVTVEAGNVLYIEAYTDYSVSSYSDYAQVSNFKFTAA